MRKLSFLLLLATAAAPALAAQDQDQDRDGRHHRSDSSEQSDGRPQRTNQDNGSATRGQRSFAVQHSEGAAGQQGGRERMRTHYQQMQQQQRQQELATGQSESHDSVRHWGGGEHQGTIGDMQDQSSWRARERHIRTIPDTQPTITQPSRTEHEAFQGRGHHDYNGGNYSRWSHNWRNDHRYDWSNWRSRHRSHFHIGFYYDPFGWNYRRWSIGSFLYPSYYGSRYWMNDPWQYRLPPAYGPYRWVRYWDDALLVNIYTGEVVDVIHNFFW
jgi:hypothetical protein